MSGTADALAPWWERRPDRLRWELTNFADRGLPSTFADGVLHTEIALSNGESVPITVSLPFEYPRRHPTVGVPRGLVGPPHEVGGDLCLFDNPGAQWHPQRDAASLIDENVRHLLEAVVVAGDTDWVAENEEQIPDAVSRLYLADSSRVIFVPDPFWNEIPGDKTRGTFFLKGPGSRRLLHLMDAHPAATSDELASRVLCTKGMAMGRWVAMENPPTGLCIASGILCAAREEYPEILDPFVSGEASLPVEYVAITFIEEGPGRGQQRRAWAFVELNGPDTVPPAAANMPQAQALTPSERQLRLPELVGLDRAKVVLVGVGSLGSKVAVELAKAGVEQMVLIDNDRYDANNAVRHELPVWQAGSLKTAGVIHACQSINPFCEVSANTSTIGSGTSAALSFLRSLDGADLVVETTGSRETTRIVQRYCRTTGVNMLTASLTRGSRGGDLVFLRPELCFDCFLVAQQEGRIPVPEQGPQPLVIPIGCANPAFSGTGFDASELSSIVARTAVRALGVTEYPALDHNWVVVNFVGEPHFQAGALDPDPACGHQDA